MPAKTMRSQREDVMSRFTQDVERYRGEYLRLKDAGNEVTAKEVAAVRQAYEEALEKLSGAFHSSRLRSPARRPLRPR